MEASISHEQNRVCVCTHAGRRAAERLARRQRPVLRDGDALEALGNKIALGGLERARELDGACQQHTQAAVEVVHHRSHKVLQVDLDLHEDVQARDGRVADGHEARVAVVHKKVGAERPRAEVVNAACAVRDVSHDERLLYVRERLENVGDDARVHEQALGELQRDAPRAGFAQPPHSLHDLHATAGSFKGILTHHEAVNKPDVDSCEVGGKHSYDVPVPQSCSWQAGASWQ